MNIQVDDKVGYRSTLKDQDFSHIGRVRSVHPDGIPSCREPMIMIEGKAGVVLATHCTVLFDVRAQTKKKVSKTCEEASSLSKGYYIPCGVAATRRILSERGMKTYSMCDECADHNVRNRGCEDTGPVE